MKTTLLRGLSTGALGCLAATQASAIGNTAEVRLITLDPGHFHAALFQKEMIHGVARRVHVYAPAGPDLVAHLNRVTAFNTRAANPTAWELEVHAAPDFFARLIAERPGNVVVISGQNRGKIDRIEAVVRAGLHTLSDKPWIIEASELPALARTLEAARAARVAAWDAMTQRFEISCIVQKELVNDAAVFGAVLTGSEREPAVYMESVHFVKKEVAGAPLLRPAWFFDPRQQGEPLADGFSEILYPGEKEVKTRKERRKSGIEIEDYTWGRVKEEIALYKLEQALAPLP